MKNKVAMKFLVNWQIEKLVLQSKQLLKNISEFALIYLIVIYVVKCELDVTLKKSKMIILGSLMTTLEVTCICAAARAVANISWD